MSDESIDRQLSAMRQILDRLTAHSMHHQAGLEVLLGLLASSGLTEVGGTPLAEWFQAETRRRLQQNLIRVEDENPALAAHLQALLDDTDPPATTGQ